MTTFLRTASHVIINSHDVEHNVSDLLSGKTAMLLFQVRAPRPLTHTRVARPYTLAPACCSMCFAVSWPERGQLPTCVPLAILSAIVVLRHPAGQAVPGRRDEIARPVARLIVLTTGSTCAGTCRARAC